MTDNRDQLTVAAGLDPQNAETILFVVERDALDQTRQHFPIGWYGLGLHDVLPHLKRAEVPEAVILTKPEPAWGYESRGTNSQSTE